MNIKTWAERAESLSDDTVVTSLHLAQFRQAEIDELRKENEQLRRALIDANHKRKNTLGKAIKLRAENERLRAALKDMVEAITGVDQVSAVNAARAALGEQT